MTYYPELIASHRDTLRRFFSKKELRSKAARNPVTRASLIEKYHRLHEAERYPFGTPPHLLTPKSIVAIIKSSK